MAWSLEDCVQRGHHFAVVDEVDSILIDEARTPLIIPAPPSRARGGTSSSPSSYRGCAGVRTGRGLRGRREEDARRRARVRRREGRGQSRPRQPLRLGEHPAGLLPQQRGQGQGAVQARQGLRRDERRGAHRRRAHRPHPARPALQRGHPPGHRGQRRRAGQGREPDPRHGHAAELLPALRQARRHDRHGHHRGHEFHQIDKLGVVPIPTNQPMLRIDQSDLVYKTAQSKFAAVVEDIVERQHGPAGARRHHQRREVRDPFPAAHAPRRRARGAQREVPRA